MAMNREPRGTHLLTTRTDVCSRCGMDAYERRMAAEAGCPGAPNVSNQQTRNMWQCLCGNRNYYRQLPCLCGQPEPKIPPNVSDQQSRDGIPTVLDVMPGDSIETTCRSAVLIANKSRRRVEFVFNGLPITVWPGELAKDVYVRWRRDQLPEEYEPPTRTLPVKPKRPASPPAKPDPLEYMLTAGKRKFRPEVEE